MMHLQIKSQVASIIVLLLVSIYSLKPTYKASARVASKAPKYIY